MLTVAVTATSTSAPPRAPGHRNPVAASGAAHLYASLLSAVGTRSAGSAVAQAAADRAQLGESEAVAAQQAGVIMPAGGVLVPAGAASAGPAGATSAPAAQQLPPVGPPQEADLFVVAPQALSPATVQAIGALSGIAAVNQVDAARIEVGGSQVATLGVDPVTFRQFAATPTASSTALWQNVAAGEVAVSYLMGQQESLPLGGQVTVTGATMENLLVGGFGTVGITGVDAVVSETVARSLGMPVGNALVVSAPHARLSMLVSSIQKLLPAAGPTAEIEILEGSPASALPEASDRLNADLIVIGRTHAPETGGYLGANAYAIIARSPCPVLSV